MPDVPASCPALVPDVPAEEEELPLPEDGDGDGDGDGDQLQQVWCLSESDADDQGGGEPCQDDRSRVGSPVLAGGDSGEWELSDASVFSQQPLQQMPCPPPPPAPPAASSARSRSPRRGGRNKQKKKKNHDESRSSHPRKVAVTLSSNKFPESLSWWCKIIQDVLQQYFERLPEAHAAFLLESLCSGAGTEAAGLQAIVLLLWGGYGGVMCFVHSAGRHLFVVSCTY